MEHMGGFLEPPGSFPPPRFILESKDLPPLFLLGLSGNMGVCDDEGAPFRLSGLVYPGTMGAKRQAV